MKAVLSLVLALSASAVQMSPYDSTPFFFPSTADGNSDGFLIFAEEAYTAQTVYTDESLNPSSTIYFPNQSNPNVDMEPIVAGTVIKGIKFRLNETILINHPQSPMNFADWTFSMGETTCDPRNSLDSSIGDPFVKTFADNRANTPDFTTYRTGSLTIPTGFFKGGAPNGINFSLAPPWKFYGEGLFDFNGPFTYQGGNILIEITHQGHQDPSRESRVFDYQLESEGNGAITEREYQTYIAESFEADIATNLMEFRAPVVEWDSCYAPNFVCNGDVECYDDMDICTRTVVGVPVNTVSAGTPGNLANIVDACGAERIYRCTTNGNNCYDLNTCMMTAIVSGDPHFYGFEGSRYNFDGTDGEVYNIISDVNFQLNALFKQMVVAGLDGTWMTKFGFLVDDQSFVYSREGLLVNGEDVLTEGSHVFGRSSIQIKSDGLIVNTPVYSLKIDTVQTPEGQQYLNLSVTMSRKPINPHGVLGQTSSFLVGKSQTFSGVEGTDSDYIVKDGITGTEFTFNTFNGAKRFATRSFDTLTEPITSSFE